MDTLTQDIIQQAFSKTVAEKPISDGKLTLIREEHYNNVLKFLREDFIPSEYISQAIHWTWNPEMEAMFVGALQKNISLMLLDNESGDIMGLRLMGVSKSDQRYTEEQFEDQGLKDVVGFWNLGDDRTQFFQRYNTDEAVHFFGLGVGAKYRQRGLGTILVDVSMKFLKNLNITPLYVKAEASSLYSMRIFEKLGFEILSEVKYEEYKKDGKIVIPSTDVNTCMRTYGLAI